MVLRKKWKDSQLDAKQTDCLKVNYENKGEEND